MRLRDGGAERLGDQHQNHRAEHGPGHGADAADDGRQHHLDGDVDPEDLIGLDEADVERGEAADQRGAGRRDTQRGVLDHRERDAEGVGSILVLADGLQVVPELAPLHHVVDGDGEDRHRQSHVEIRGLAVPVGDHGAAELQRRQIRGEDSFGAVREVLGVEREQADDLRDRDTRQHEVGAAQAEGDPAHHQGDDHAQRHRRPDAEPGRDPLALQQDERGVSAESVPGGVADGVLTREPADHVPALAEGDGDEQQDEDVQSVRALDPDRDQGQDHGSGCADDERLHMRLFPRRPEGLSSSTRRKMT